ncbi:MAG: DNA polymerase [Acidimicrobiia bacterium]
MNGFTETLYGRRRYFPGISSSNGRIRMAEERAATNAPVQGTAADIFKLSMILAAKEIEKYGKDVAMILTVHDELVFEVKTELIDQVTKNLVDAMENVVNLDVPLTVDVGVGSNWAEAK